MAPKTTVRKKPGSPKGQAKPLKRSLDPEFPTRLRQAMAARNTTVPQMARALGCTRAALLRYVNGVPKKVDVHLFIDICDYLGIAPHYLLYGDRALKSR